MAETAGQLSIELEGFPSAVRPMQAVSAEAPFSSPDYLFEVKWDGLRAVLLVGLDGSIRVHDRALQPITGRLQNLVAAARDRLPRGTVLDGELVTTDDEGRPDPTRLRAWLAGADDVPEPGFLAFDLLYLDGKPQLRQPLARRKARLGRALASGDGIFIPDHIEKEGVELYEACLERGLEGVMAKHMASTYVPGQRSPFWLKVKAVKSDDFVVTGWVPGDHGDGFAALMVGYYEQGRLLPCGTVTGGTDAESAEAVRARLEELASEESPLEPPPVMMAPVRWVRPELVIAVRYSEWAPDGTLRFPIFDALRPEIHPAECVRHRPRVVAGNQVPPDSPVYGLTRFPF